MSVPEKQLAELKQKIVKAFEAVPYPKDPIAPHECEECREVRKTFANQHWKTIEPAILEENHGIIPLFSPDAFRFFLPAYLIYSLDHFSEEYDTTTEFTIYAVTPSNKDIKAATGYWQEKFAGFDREQFSCVDEFLGLVGIDENFQNLAKQVGNGRQNLKTFIEPIIRK